VNSAFRRGVVEADSFPNSKNEEDGNGFEELSLADAATHLFEECRMMLPGVQALLGSSSCQWRR